MSSEDHEIESRTSKSLKLNPWFLGILLSATVFIVADLFLESYFPRGDRRHDEQGKTIDTLFKESAFGAEQLKLARKFETDTLPRLLKAGIIKQFKRSNQMTLVFVDEQRWKNQPHEAKVDVLSELLASNLVNGYSSWTDVRDFETGKLLAGISFSGSVELYE